MELEVEITRLGAQGDAVAERPDGQIFVPFTLPGERVRVAVDPKSDHATLLDVLEQSAERVAPVCPHFGVCGGCALQHMEVRAYLRWKHDQVVAALRSRGLDARSMRSDRFRSAAGGGQVSPLAEARRGPRLAITSPARTS
jgi:23S rRNA (uracil1939-C5)-methyltransferase